MKKYLKQILPNSVYVKLKGYKYIVDRQLNIFRERRSKDFIKRKMFYTNFLSPGDLYFDIGANYGNRIGPIRQIGKIKVVAVEPQKDCCNYLERRFSDITIIQKGVGSQEEIKTFYVSDESVLSSFSEVFINRTGQTRFKGNTWNRKEQVEITTLDRLIEQHGIPKFIKVDVEGYEPEVFNGLSKRVNYISFEYTVPELEQNITLILNRLNSIGLCEFNYSEGESMELGLPDWIGHQEMLKFVSESSFSKTGFGDIYVRFV